MKRITTYRDKEGYHTLWAITSGVWKLESHTTKGIKAISTPEALAIIHRYGYGNTRIYAPSPSEKWERPKAMQEIETGVFSWSES